MDATLAAFITGAFGLIMFLIEKGRRENVRDHGIVSEKLNSLASNMQDVKIDVLDLKSDIKEIDEDISNLEKQLIGHLAQNSQKSVD